MAISSFIPQVWSARLTENLHKNLVFGRLVNRSYEGDISQYGDTVHIPNLADITVRTYDPDTALAEPEALSGTDIALTIDHGVYYNFYINDVDAAQARVDVMDGAMRNAAYRLAEDTESYILTTIRSGAGTKKSGALPTAAKGGLYAQIVTIKGALDTAKVPRQNRKLVLPVSLENELLMDDRFVTGSLAANERLEDGCVGRVAGFDVFISQDMNQEIVAFIPDAVAFVNQITNVEAYRPEKGFCDGVKGLNLCGAKVIIPSAVYHFTITA